MKLESKVPCIPKQGVMSFEDWLAGRRVRRESGNLVAPEIIRRKDSSSDRPFEANLTETAGCHSQQPKSCRGVADYSLAV